MDFNCKFLNVTRNIQKSDSEMIIYNYGITNSISNSTQESKKEPWYEEFIRNNEGIINEWFK